MSSFIQMQSPSGSGSLPSNTVANPRGDLKAFTTRSGVAYDRPMIPPTPSPLPKVVERETKATKDKESVNRIDVIDVSCEEYAQEVLGFLGSSKSVNPTPLDPIIASSSPSFTPFEGKGDIVLIEKLLNEDLSPNLPPVKNEDLKLGDVTMTKPSTEEPLELELKDLPSHLEYAFLEGTDKLSIITSKELKDKEKAALLKTLKSHKRAIAWNISDIKGIDPHFYTQKILMEDDFKPAETMEVMDDFSVFEDSFSLCLFYLDKMLKRCEDANLVLNWEKCHFRVKEGIVLGHKISKSGIEVDRAKVDVIAKLPHPTSVKDYCIMNEGMSILRGRKSVPGMKSSEREMERGYYSAFTQQELHLLLPPLKLPPSKCSNLTISLDIFKDSLMPSLYETHSKIVSSLSRGKEGNIREESSTRFNPDALLISVTNVEALLGVKFNSQHDIDTFSKSVVEGKYVDIFSKMSSDEIDVVVDAIETITKKFLASDDNSRPNVTKQVIEPNHDDPIIHDVNINTKSTSYAGAAGANHKVQQKITSNFRPLVYDPVFEGVNISIPRKVVEKALIILKKWSMDTRLLKEELTCIPVWVRLHDVPIQVFEDDGISLIASFTGEPVMLNSYTSSMCNDSWGRSSFARCLIEVNSEADLVDVVTIGIPSLTGDDFIKETIRVEYEWRPLRYEPKAATSEPKEGATNVSNTSKSSSMVKSTGNSSKKGNITTSNSYSALENDEEEDKEHVENVYDESANLFPNSKPGESLTFTVAAG
uniref:Zinc knuckle CX2CX4HX4C n=1 Tax=Tanacetum cinerariifolium TaxID=118510 RepID=A0A6L2NI54_TANCI|nr:zinc knuckle CX2CX4HX4C [Tanacetum cinerariifolium]